MVGQSNILDTYNKDQRIGYDNKNKVEQNILQKEQRKNNHLNYKV